MLGLFIKKQDPNGAFCSGLYFAFSHSQNMNQRLGPNKKFLNSPLRYKKEGLIAILSQSPSSPSQYPQLSPRLEFLVTEAVK